MTAHRSPVARIIVSLSLLLALGLALPGQAQSPAPIASAVPSAEVDASAVPSQAVAGSWSAGIPLPAKRAETSGAVIDGRIHLPGGLDQLGGLGSRTLTSMLVFDPATGTYTEAAPLPAARDHAALSVWDGKLYLSGGGEFGGGSKRRPNLWVYDPAKDEWKGLARMPASRWQHAMVVIDGVLYVVGGLIFDQMDHTPIWAYDIKKNEWRTDLAPMPTAREHLGAVAVDGKVVVIGGRLVQNFGTVEIYDPATNTWSTGPDMPTPRGGFTIGVMDDGIHVTGGEDLNEYRTIAAHELLDPQRMTWSTLPDLPNRRHGLMSGVVDGRWYVMGGGRAAGLSTTDMVDVWTEADAG